ncbi:MAG: YicC family protein [Acidobacteria bacterium]|nr:MAG: YicC family protein [Acidobacteriota bacterium]
MRSMTGYGQATGENSTYRIAVTIRSVNHRYLDLVIRLRDEHRHLEALLRELIGERLTRGRVEVRVDIETLASPEISVDLRADAVEAIERAVRDLAKGGLVSEIISLSDLLRIPDVVRVTSSPAVWSDEDRALFERATAEALDEVVALRAQEGKDLAHYLRGHIDKLSETVKEIEARRPVFQQELATRLEERIGEMTDVDKVPAERIAQEVAFLVDRSDVQEEVDRLGSHLAHFRKLLEEEGAVGKRLDFLSQELLRELNTLGSKGRDVETIRLVLDAKLLCEQLREQVQNIE